MYNIDITMTAVLRPKILNKTLQSIIENVVDNIDRFRLVINIDPVGQDIDPMRVIGIAKSYFPNVKWNIPYEPSFPRAVKWVWSQSDSPFIFHWEDDVKILRKINVNDMIRILLKYDTLSSLRLYRDRTPRAKSFHTFSCKWRYNADGFYMASDWRKQFGLNPILIKRQFIDQALPRMRDDINPEKQFRESQEYMRPVIKEWRYGLYTKPGEARLVDGRQGQIWKNQVGWDKPEGVTFTKWVKKEK
jgi:hypothetical protein